MTLGNGVGISIESADMSAMQAELDSFESEIQAWIATEEAGRTSYATTSDLTTGLAGKAALSHTHTASQITDFASAITALGYKKTVTYSGLTAGFTLVTLLGSSYLNVTISGLLTTDNLVECVPTVDLPANLVWNQARISATNTVRLCVSSGVLYTGSPNIGFQVTVLR